MSDMGFSGTGDLQEMAARVRSDENGAVTSKMLAEIDRYCDQLEEQMDRETDLVRGRTLKATLDALTAARDLMPIIWSRIHGREFPEERAA